MVLTADEFPPLISHVSLNFYRLTLRDQARLAILVTTRFSFVRTNGVNTVPSDFSPNFNCGRRPCRKISIGWGRFCQESGKFYVAIRWVEYSVRRRPNEMCSLRNGGVAQVIKQSRRRKLPTREPGHMLVDGPLALTAGSWHSWHCGIFCT